MRLRIVMLALLIIFWSGCASKQIVLYPITDNDIYFKDNGDICFSEKYFGSVLQAKIEKFR